MLLRCCLLLLSDPGDFATMSVKPALANPLNATYIASQNTIEFNGFSDFLNLNTQRDSGWPLRPDGVTIPKLVLSPPTGEQIGRLRGDGWSAEGWFDAHCGS